MSSFQNKIKMSSYYNNKYTVDNKIKLKNKRELLKLTNLKNINMNFNNKYNNKNKSCSKISENISFKTDNQIKEKDEDKLIIKTSLIKPKNGNNEQKKKDEKDKYHINFELLAKAGINNDININMTFV